MIGSAGTRRGPRRVGARMIGLGLIGPAVLAVLIYGGISLHAAGRLTGPTNHAATMDPRRSCPEARRWSTRTDDGIVLRGWYLPTRGQGRLIVLVHGLWGCWEEMAKLGIDLNARGFDVLLFDLRGHGESDPSRLSLGHTERADIRAAWAWAHSRGFSDDRIGWLGYSMGGSILLIEGASNPHIRALVADSAYSDLRRSSTSS